MIFSMTAFARTETKTEVGKIVCEMRSVNHRYLDFTINLSDTLRAFEMPVRERVREKLSRGKVDCFMRLHHEMGKEQGVVLELNQPLLEALQNAADDVSSNIKQVREASFMEILQFPGVIKTKETDAETLKPLVISAIEKTLEELISVRAREGKELERLFLQRFTLMQEELQKIKLRLPQIAADHQARLQKRLSDCRLELQPERLEQEILLFSQKSDVSEEIDRTEAHITEFQRVLKQGGAIGRRLDFLLQELNREANTLSSKSTDLLTTHAAVEMKVLIEQVREQVQNIE